MYSQNKFGHVEPTGLTIAILAVACIGVSIVANAPEPAEAEPKNISTVQTVTAPEVTEDFERSMLKGDMARPTFIHYITPDEEDRLLAEQVAQPVHTIEPVEPIAPGSDTTEPVTLDAPTCEEQGLITAEDGSCVNPEFYSESTWYPAGYEPCETEDSAGPCYWDAATMGNGQGESFYVSPDGRIFYRG